MSISRDLAVIGGAAGGIGKCIALKCASMSMDIALYDINGESLESVDKEIKSLYPNTNIGIFICDVSKMENVRFLVNDIMNYFKNKKSIQYLFNNVGVMRCDSILKGDINKLYKTFDVNFWSIIYLTQLFLPYLLENYKLNKQSYIINTASIGSFFTPNDIYGVSKHSVLALTEAINEEIKIYFNKEMKNIHVAALCPSYTKSNLHPDSVKNAKELNLNLNKNAMLKARDFGYKFLEMTPENLVDILFDGLKNKKFIIHGDIEVSMAAVNDRVKSMKNGKQNDWRNYVKLRNKRRKQYKSKL